MLNEVKHLAGWVAASPDSSLALRMTFGSGFLIHHTSLVSISESAFLPLYQLKQDRPASLYETFDPAEARRIPWASLGWIRINLPPSQVSSMTLTS